MENTQLASENSNSSDQQLVYTLPPLRLQTPRGGELEIDSIFQRNLRIAKLCNLLELPGVLTDWRLPKARVPAKPDYSRSSVPMFRRVAADNLKDGGNQSEKPTKDVSTTQSAENSCFNYLTSKSIYKKKTNKNMNSSFNYLHLIFRIIKLMHLSQGKSVELHINKEFLLPI